MAMTDLEALIFDMDGTLVDSESFTERVVEACLRHAGIRDDGIEPTRLHGVTWRHIEALLVDRHPGLRGQSLAEQMQQQFHALLLQEPPPFIPGAVELLHSVQGRLPVAIATSSNRQSVLSLLERDELRGFTPEIVSAEDYRESKPSPDCYRLAAQRLGVDPRAAAAFEDSIAGIRAASAAGMKVVSILYRCADPPLARRLADLSIQDYTELGCRLSRPAPAAMVELWPQAA